eukprot:2188528-Pleurochrysis_carterae.AAC.1
MWPSWLRRNKAALKIAAWGLYVSGAYKSSNSKIRQRTMIRSRVVQPTTTANAIASSSRESSPREIDRD